MRAVTKALQGSTRVAVVGTALLAGVVVLSAAGVVREVMPRLDTASTPTAGSWTAHLTAASDDVTDARGVVWSAGSDLEGGSPVRADATSPGTASPQLYQQVRQGATSWAADVPAPGWYAVDLLVNQPDAAAPAGTDVFDVVAGDAGSDDGTVLVSGLDLVSGTPLPQHATGWVQLEGDRLELRFPADAGDASVTGLVLTSLGEEGPAPLLDDTFDGPEGSAPPEHWVPVVGPGPHGAGEVEGYSADPSAVSLDGRGSLVLTATRQEYPEPYTDAAGEQVLQPWTSGRVETKGRFDLTYGTVSATAQVPAGQGLWPAFWMLGADVDTNPWPRAGEIDVMEVLGQQPSQLYSSVRASGDELDAPDEQGRVASRLGAGTTAPEDLSAGMHTYAAALAPGWVTFSLDDAPYQTVSAVDLRSGQQWPLGKPYSLLLNLAVGGTWGGPPDETTPESAALVVDSVTATGWR
jgi:hypothetical protein